MGTDNSTSISHQEMDNSLIGLVREEHTVEGDFVNLYYRPDKDIIVMDKGEAVLGRKSYDSLSKFWRIISDLLMNLYHLEWRDYFKMNHVVDVKIEEDTKRMKAKHKYKLSIMYYDDANDNYRVKRYYFLREVEFKYAQNKFTRINWLERNGFRRYLCIFVNPISGK